MKKIIFIGAGSMAEALIQGWIASKVVQADHIYVTNHSNQNRLKELQEIYQVNILKNKEEIKEADLIVLAMKPKDLVTALQSIQQYVSEQTAVLSVVAGISIATIEEYLGQRAIVRVMPNTSATIGMSASGITFNNQVKSDQKLIYMQMLKAIGVVVEVNEEQLHAVTALSGSGPAYVYYLIEAWEEIGTQFGLSKDVVRELMIQTLTGAATMLKNGKEEPSELRKKVTSPGGTTEAGIKALEKHHFKQAIYDCIKSAELRSRELAELSKTSVSSK